MPQDSEPRAIAGPEAAPPPATAAGSASPWVAAAPELPVPMPFPLLLDEAVRWMRRYLRQIYAPFAMTAAVLAAGGATVELLVRNAMGDSRDPIQVMMTGCSAALISLPLAFLNQGLGAAMGHATVDALCGRRPAFGRSLRFAVRPAVLGTLVLQFLCIVAAVLCCLVPVLFVAPLLGLVVPVMAAEGAMGSNALRRSAQLTRYNPAGTLLASPRLKLLALFVLIFVVSLLLASLPELPLIIAQRGSILRRLAAGENLQQSLTTWAQVPMRAVVALLATPLQLFGSFAVSLFFFDLRARREGDDLRRDIAGLTAGLDAGPLASTAPTAPTAPTAAAMPTAPAVPPLLLP